MSEELHLPMIDRRDLIQLDRVVLVMREAVVTLGDPELRISPVTPSIAEHKSADAGEVTAERAHAEIEEEARMLSAICGSAFRSRLIRITLSFLLRV